MFVLTDTLSNVASIYLCIQFLVLSGGGKRDCRCQKSHTARGTSAENGAPGNTKSPESRGRRAWGQAELIRRVSPESRGQMSTRFQGLFYNDFLQFLCFSLVLEGSAKLVRTLSTFGFWALNSVVRLGSRYSPTEPSPAPPPHLDFCSLLSSEFKMSLTGSSI